MTSFAAMAALNEELAATRSRIKLAELIAAFLRSLAADEVAPATRLIIGRIFPEGDARTLNLSSNAVVRVLQRIVPLDWSATSDSVDFGGAAQVLLQRAAHQAAGEALSLLDVYHAFEEIAAASGARSRERKDTLLEALLRRSSAVEAKYIIKAVVGEMRHGVSEGIVLDGIARAAAVPADLVRRANQSAGDLGLVAGLALSKGAPGLDQMPLRPGHPLKPMLAQTASDVAEAFATLGGKLGLECKLDGARLQIHKNGDEIHLFSRQLADLTDSLPDVVALLREQITLQSAILEGEVIAIAADGRPLPFQRLMQRLGRVRDIDAVVNDVPTRLYLFDVLYLNGESWLDRPYAARWQALQDVHGDIALAPRITPLDVKEGEAFLKQARADGHEGVMAKALASPYQPGKRGQGWLKIKPVLTLDLVVVAAEWGYGRRHGWLSNYHLAARDAESGELLVVGKTFKGPTDAAFIAMTERLLALKTRETRGTVHVRPEIVAEVAFNNIQTSPQYKSGMALRFARIVRWRDDKPAAEADTIQTLRQLHRAEWRTSDETDAAATTDVEG
jgi:DNA ligase 1